MNECLGSILCKYYRSSATKESIGNFEVQGLEGNEHENETADGDNVTFLAVMCKWDENADDMLELKQWSWVIWEVGVVWAVYMVKGLRVYMEDVVGMVDENWVVQR